MTLPERAQQIWQVLINAAFDRQVLTYTHVADRIGMGAGTLAPALELVMSYCAENGLPPLTVLVVNKETGLPGSGLTTVEDLPRDREAVYNTAWLALPPLQAADFAGVMTSRTAPERHRGDASSLTERTNSGATLNKAWGVGAVHALYHKDGCWYHQLTAFPGALFDPHGYVLFETEEDFRNCRQLRIEQDVNVEGVLSDIPGYVRVVS